jgi:Flp pilus assembly protein TadG
MIASVSALQPERTPLAANAENELDVRRARGPARYARVGILMKIGTISGRPARKVDDAVAKPANPVLRPGLLEGIVEMHDDDRVSSESRTQAGSAMLEAALVLLPMMAIFFAMIDFPFAVFIQNTLREAVREGVRFGITQQTGSSGQDAAIESVVINNSLGFLNAADIAAGKSTFTLTYYNGATLSTVTSTGSNAQGNICVVTVSVQRSWMAPVWRSTGLLNFSASSSDVMEAPPGGVLPSR